MVKLSKYFSRAFIYNSSTPCSTALGAVVGAAGYRCHPGVSNESGFSTGELKAPLMLPSATGIYTDLLSNCHSGLLMAVASQFCND